MGCFGKNKGHIDESAKWAYINLSDFHATSSWTPFSYLTVWFFALVGVAVFAVDCFTAVNLLILDKWASQIKPAIDLKYSKWIFVGCIMFSFALYAYEWMRAIRVIRRGGIAESYMDPLAVQLQCMRPKGWKRFLVCASLTKSQKGTDYIAFFVYFQFNSAVRIIVAEGGRQFINAATIVSVARADLIPVGAHAGEGNSPFIQFFLNLAELWNKSNQQAILLFSMAFTLFIWIFSAICLIIALILYLLFLWHYIPQSDGRLSIYLRRKVDRRLEKIVEKKVQAALEESERKRQRDEARQLAAGGKNSAKGPTIPGQLARQPTLPDLGKFDEEKNSGGFGLVRSETVTTLPPYTSRPPTRNDEPFPSGLQRQPTLPGFDANPPRLARQNTGMSGYSDATYSSNTSLLQNANGMGYDSRSESPMCGPPPFGRQMSGSSMNPRVAPIRTLTSSTQSSQRSYGGPPRGMPQRSNTGMSSIDDLNPLSRSGSAMSGGSGNFAPPSQPQRSHTANPTYTIPEQPLREQTPASNYAAPMYGQGANQNRIVSRQTFNRPFSNENRPHFDSRAPTPAAISERTSPVNGLGGGGDGGGGGGSGGYVAFNPYAARAPSVPAPATAHATPSPSPLSSSPSSRRNLTGPVELQPLSSSQQQSFSGRFHQGQQPQRSATAPIPRDAFSSSPSPSPAPYDAGTRF